MDAVSIWFDYILSMSREAVKTAFPDLEKLPARAVAADIEKIRSVIIFRRYIEVK
jgi:hypothetical protein